MMTEMIAPVMMPARARPSPVWVIGFSLTCRRPMTPSTRPTGAASPKIPQKNPSSPQSEVTRLAIASPLVFIAGPDVYGPTPCGSGWPGAGPYGFGWPYGLACPYGWGPYDPDGSAPLDRDPFGLSPWWGSDSCRPLSEGSYGLLIVCPPRVRVGRLCCLIVASPGASWTGGGATTGPRIAIVGATTDREGVTWSGCVTRATDTTGWQRPVGMPPQ